MNHSILFIVIDEGGDIDYKNFRISGTREDAMRFFKKSIDAIREFYDMGEYERRDFVKVVTEKVASYEIYFRDTDFHLIAEMEAEEDCIDITGMRSPEIKELLGLCPGRGIS